MALNERECLERTLEEVIRDSAGHPDDLGLRRIAHDACLDAGKLYWAEALAWMIRHGKRPLEWNPDGEDSTPFTWNPGPSMYNGYYNLGSVHCFPAGHPVPYFLRADGWHATAFAATMALLEDWEAARREGWTCEGGIRPEGE